MLGHNQISVENISGVLGEIVAGRVQDYQDKEFVLGEKRSYDGRFKQALLSKPLSLIAEVKRSSPSNGKIAALDPAKAASEYQKGGASAISCLTEPRYFDGSLDALTAVVGSVSLPVLRKDFVIHPAMLLEAANLGAGAALLMVSVLGEATAEYLRVATHLGLDALVEVHNEPELEIAIQSGASIIGVNNRNLKTLAIDLDISPALIMKARESGFDGVLVAESGYKTPEDLISIRGLADAVLVGSSLASSANLYSATQDLMRI